MNNYRLTKEGLWAVLEGWDPYLPSKVRVVACGGTALTLQDLKESTKDVDFLVPHDDEYRELVRTLKKLDYRPTSGSGWSRGDGLVFDLFAGNTVFQTELLESPLDKGNHIPIKAFKKLEVSALNDYDLVITKMFRGTEVDVEDCLRLIRNRGQVFDVEKLKGRYEEAALYVNNEQSVLGNLAFLLKRLED